MMHANYPDGVRTMMTMLVAGGAGFIGSHLCERLLHDGHEVICLDNLLTGRRENIAHMLDQPRFTFLHHDAIGILPALPRIDQIFHAASPASPPVYQRNPLETMRVNSEGTRQLLDLAEQNNALFLFFSTSEVYGDPLEHPQRETYFGNVSPCGPRSVYDEAKRYGEALTMAYARTRNVKVRIVRIFNTYGPRLDPNDGRVVSTFIVQALQGDPLTIFGDGSQTRSFQYVDDLIEGLLRVMRGPHPGPINLGNPEEYTMYELAHLILELTGSESPIVFEPLPQDDPKQRRPDISLAQTLTGWQPEVCVREGLIRTIAYFKEQIP